MIIFTPVETFEIKRCYITAAPCIPRINHPIVFSLWKYQKLKYTKKLQNQTNVSWFHMHLMTYIFYLNLILWHYVIMNSSLPPFNTESLALRLHL